MALTRILKPLVPPVLWTIGSGLRRQLMRSVDHYAYAPDGWETRLPACGGNEAHWRTFIPRDRALCEALIARVQADPVALTADDEALKAVAFGYVLALAARKKQTVTVLDYGGSLGEYYWIGKALVTGVELEYHCKELPAIAEAGRQLSPQVIWHTDDSCLAASYDLVMFSASLPYLPDWQGVLRVAAQAAREYLWLSQIPAVRAVPTYVITQRSGGVTHLQYVLNRPEVIDTVRRAGLRLVRQIEMGSHPAVRNAPEQPEYAGWLFQR